MVTIPRYASRTLPGGQLNAGVDDMRGEALERLAGIAGSVSGLASGLKGFNDMRSANLARREEAAAKAADVAFRRGAREALDGMAAGGSEAFEPVAAAIRAARERAAGPLSGAALERFETLSAPRELGLLTEAAASAEGQARQAAAALSRTRQAMGVEDFLRLAEVDEGQARIALASAGGELAERLAAEGADEATSAAARRDFISRVQAERVARRIDEDPDAGERLLDQGGALLTDEARAALGRRLADERLRREAGATARGLLEAVIGAGGEAAAADDLGGLMARIEALADDAPADGGGGLARREAYRAAMTGAWRAARREREAREGAAWAGAVAAMTELAGQGGGAAAWTDLPGTVWSALSPRQQAALKARMAAPHADSEPAATAFLNRLAASDTAGFRELDLGELYGALTPQDHAGWRAMQDLARAGGVEWRQARADIARLTRAIDAGAPGADDAARGRLHEMLADAEALNGGPLDHAALAAICQQATSELERALAPRATPVPPPNYGKALLEADGNADPIAGLGRSFVAPVIEDINRPPPAPPPPPRPDRVEPLAAMRDPQWKRVAPETRPGGLPDLSVLTRAYERHAGENPEAFVSSGWLKPGKRDPGGRSYGVYQMASAVGTVDDFLDSPEGAPYKAFFKGHDPRGSEFAALWPLATEQFGPAFQEAQYRFNKGRYLDRPLARVEAATGMDLSNRSPIVYASIWSISAQAGQNETIFEAAIANIRRDNPQLSLDEISDQMLVDAFYRERIARAKTPELVLRFRRERLSALNLLYKEPRRMQEIRPGAPAVRDQ